jgi:hypothetical protein
MMMAYRIMVRGDAKTPKRFWDVELVTAYDPMREAKLVTIGYRSLKTASDEEAMRWLSRVGGASYGDIADEFNGGPDGNI